MPAWEMRCYWLLMACLVCHSFYALYDVTGKYQWGNTRGTFWDTDLPLIGRVRTRISNENHGLATLLIALVGLQRITARLEHL